MSESTVTLIVPAVGASAYWLCALWKRKACGLEKLFLLAVNFVGAVTGVYIFLWAIKLGSSSTQYAAWAGITGVCMTFYTLGKIKEEFSCLLAQPILPRTDSSTYRRDAE